MNHWPFVIAAYAIVLAGTGGLCVWAHAAMRRAERRADAVTSQPRQAGQSRQADQSRQAER
ncbi:heme exporter protein CcmD [Sphingomonas montana]|uniref:heme exporter protein CcmD n=1 Tax=Sphingomonas montana TaxID=1843236 RepID=UPI00096FBA4F|nr:heme exporter protein CcmD [Sphingomonas montana]